MDNTIQYQNEKQFSVAVQYRFKENISRVYFPLFHFNYSTFNGSKTSRPLLTIWSLAH